MRERSPSGGNRLSKCLSTASTSLEAACVSRCLMSDITSLHATCSLVSLTAVSRGYVFLVSTFAIRTPLSRTDSSPLKPKRVYSPSRRCSV